MSTFAYLFVDLCSERFLALPLPNRILFVCFIIFVVRRCPRAKYFIVFVCKQKLLFL